MSAPASPNEQQQQQQRGKIKEEASPGDTDNDHQHQHHGNHNTTTTTRLAPLLEHHPSSPFHVSDDEYVLYTDDIILSDEGSYGDLEADDEIDDDLSDDEAGVLMQQSPPPPARRTHKAPHQQKKHVVEDDDNDEDDVVEDDGADADADDEKDIGRAIMPPPLTTTTDDAEADNASASPSSPVTQRSKHLSAVLLEDKPWRSSRPRTASNNSTSSSITGSSRHFLRLIRKPWSNKPEHENNTAQQQQPQPPQPPPLTNDLRSASDILVDDSSSSSQEEEEALSVAESSVDSWDLQDSNDGNDDELWQLPATNWKSLAVLPNRFLAVHNVTTAAPPPYLDPGLLREHSLTQHNANVFVWEHGMLLQAVMNLLAERDLLGVEGQMDSADNIWKKGPLKKLSYSVGRRQRPASTRWKVKYVELRRGNLCYYEDSGQGRKTIHLRLADTVIQESDKAGFVFEVLVQGSPARFWMASSEEERQGWIRALRVAMIGGEEGPLRDLDLTQHREALDVYQNLKSSLQNADTQEAYLEAIQSSLQELAVNDLTSLQVPVQWVRDQVEAADTTKRASSQLIDRPRTASTQRVPPHKQLKASVDDFWSAAGETTFSINGITVPRTSPLSSERIVGALTRCILEFDKAFVPDDPDAEGENAAAGTMSELQAVSYTRNILMAVLRGKEQQDAACAVNHLLDNLDLVVVSGVDDQEDAVVHMEVSFAGEDIQDDHPRASDEQTGWLWTRRKQSGLAKWKKRFACLSGAVLSYYEAASPRPHGLRGQLVLGGATVQQEEGHEGAIEDDRYILCITAHDHERLLAFDLEEEYDAWKNAIQVAIDSLQCVAQVDSGDLLDESQPPDQKIEIKQGKKSLSKSVSNKLKGAERAIKGAIPDAKIRGSIRVIKDATGGGMKVINDARVGSIKVIKGAVGRLRQKNSTEADDNSSVLSSGMQRRPSMQMLLNNATVLAGKREPTVQCVVQSTSTFGIVERHDGSDEEGAACIISVRAKLFQAFLLSGGPSGRMARGDALVELEFLEPAPNDDDEEDEDEEVVPFFF